LQLFTLGHSTSLHSNLLITIIKNATQQNSNQIRILGHEIPYLDVFELTCTPVIPNAIEVHILAPTCIANDIRNNVAQTPSHAYNHLKYQKDIQ
jgi:hypothetical protein